MIDAWARFASHTAGPLRSRDEDRVLERPDLGLFAVADGMGGHPCGDEAAELTLAAIEEGCSGDASLERLGAAFLHANSRLLDTSRARALPKPMGCVATVAWLDPLGDPGRLLVGHVGDTRAYIFDGQGRGRQLTVDHSGEQRAALSEHDALASPARHVVARAVGVEAVDQAEGWVDLREARLEPGELLLLCTDGLSDYVELGQVSRLVADHADELESLGLALTRACTEAQLRLGRGDNLGLVLLARPDRVHTERATVLLGERATLQPGFAPPPMREPLPAPLPAPPPGGAWPRIARGVLALTTLSMLGAVASWAAVAMIASQDASATITGTQVLDSTLPSAALCSRWESRSVVGPDAAIVLVPCEAWTVASDAQVRMSEVALTGSGPDHLVVEEGAQLVFDGVSWFAPEHEVVISLGRGASLTMVSSHLDVGSLQVELGERSSFEVRGESELRSRLPGPLITTAGPGSLASFASARLYLHDGALAAASIVLDRHVEACDLSLQPPPAADSQVAALLQDDPPCPGSER